MLDDEVRVVVVDDNEDVAETLAELLRLDGYAARVAFDGTSAMDVIDEFQPHCVLLDVNMPGGGGDGLSKALRQRFGDDVILIAVTGQGRGQAQVESTFARVDHYLMKPVKVEELRKVLRPIVRGAPAPGKADRPSSS